MPVYERQRRGEPISSAVRDVPSGFGPFDFHKRDRGLRDRAVDDLANHLRELVRAALGLCACLKWSI